MVEQAIEGSKWAWWLFPSLSAVGGAIGGLFGSYFSKLAEIAAIQNQLDKVVHQNERIVKSSEEIKDKVSGRRRMWELKREVAFDVMKTTGVIGHLFVSLSGVYLSMRKSQLTPELRVKLFNDVN